MITVQLVYALPNRLWQQVLQLPEGSDLRAAVAASRLLADHPELGTWPDHIGIHGRKQTAETKLRDQDRIEIYRPLLIDPKDARRQRASRLRERR